MKAQTNRLTFSQQFFIATFKNQDNYPKLMNETIDLAVKMRDVLKKYI